MISLCSSLERVDFEVMASKRVDSTRARCMYEVDVDRSQLAKKEKMEELCRPNYNNMRSCILPYTFEIKPTANRREIYQTSPASITECALFLPPVRRRPSALPCPSA